MVAPPRPPLPAATLSAAALALAGLFASSDARAEPKMPRFKPCKPEPTIAPPSDDVVEVPTVASTDTIREVQVTIKSRHGKDDAYEWQLVHERAGTSRTIARVSLTAPALQSTVKVGKVPPVLGLGRPADDGPVEVDVLGPHDLDADGRPDWVLTFPVCHECYDPSPYHVVSVATDGRVTITPALVGYRWPLTMTARGARFVEQDGMEHRTYELRNDTFCVDRIVHPDLHAARRAKVLARIPERLPAKLDELGRASWTERHALAVRGAPTDVDCEVAPSEVRDDLRTTCHPEGLWSSAGGKTKGFIRVLETVHEGYRDLLVNDTEVKRWSCSAPGSCSYE